MATAFAVVWGVAHSSPTEQQLSFWVLLGAMSLWGIVGAAWQGAGQALYADSIPSGQRSYYYNILFIIWLLTSALGPAVTIGLFVYHGNTWSLPDLRNRRPLLQHPRRHVRHRRGRARRSA